MSHRRSRLPHADTGRVASVAFVRLGDASGVARMRGTGQLTHPSAALPTTDARSELGAVSSLSAGGVSGPCGGRIARRRRALDGGKRPDSFRRSTRSCGLSGQGRASSSFRCTSSTCLRRSRCAEEVHRRVVAGSAAGRRMELGTGARMPVRRPMGPPFAGSWGQGNGLNNRVGGCLEMASASTG